jgi:hypothetical protein
VRGGYVEALTIRRFHHQTIPSQSSDTPTTSLHWLCIHLNLTKKVVVVVAPFKKRIAGIIAWKGFSHKLRVKSRVLSMAAKEREDKRR